MSDLATVQKYQYIIMSRGIRSPNSVRERTGPYMGCANNNKKIFDIVSGPRAKLLKGKEASFVTVEKRSARSQMG